MLTIREDLSQLFPDLIFYETPVRDESISGISLLFDEDPVWVVTYDENILIENLAEDFSENEDPYLDAVEWYNYNILHGYIGCTTPVFYNSCGNVASRCNTQYDNVLSLSDFDTLFDAIKYIQNDHNAIIYVPVALINEIKNWL